MMPAFDERGYLPPGIHGATLDEVADRFGQETELRKVQMESLTIVNPSQLENARGKLKLLEEQCASLKSQPAENAYTRDLTLQALQRWIKELKEDILRYECKTPSGANP